MTAPASRRPVDLPEESLMLTGDQNIADVKFVVIWQIDPVHPENYAFNIANRDDTVKAVAESAMREVIGHSLIQQILTAERKVIEPEVQDLMQKILNSYKAGVLVLQVQLQSVDPPQASDRRLPRCDRGAAGSRPDAQRGRGLCQSRRAGGARPGRGDPSAGGRLSPADGR